MFSSRLGRRLFATHYDILKVPRDAAHRAIKAAYRKEARRVHPDRPGGSTEGFKRLQQAYEILSDPQRRREYDESVRTGNPFKQREPGFRRYQAQYHEEAAAPENPGNQALTFFALACGIGVLVSSLAEEEKVPARRNFAPTAALDPNVPTTRAYFNPISRAWERLSESQGPPMVLDFVDYYRIPYKQRHLLPRYFKEETRPLDETIEPQLVQDLNSKKTIRVGGSATVAEIHPDAIQF